MEVPLEQIILFLYFPQFKSSNYSRFESFFMSAKEKEKNNFKNTKINTSNIFPEKIARNEDKRTSVIIKGIPKDMPKNDVRNLINKYGNINYLYIIKSPKVEEKNVSMAFVNFINYKSIIPLFMNLRKLKIEKNGKNYKLSVEYSNMQGKQKIKEYMEKNKYFKH